MAIAHSKLTAQGQISVPASVRRKLGVGPGSVLEWEERDGEVLVRRAGRVSSGDMHEVLFPKDISRTKSPAQLKAGISKYVRKRHARD
jgi:antitoxin PrlF